MIPRDCGIVVLDIAFAYTSFASWENSDKLQNVIFVKGKNQLCCFES